MIIIILPPRRRALRCGEKKRNQRVVGVRSVEVVSSFGRPSGGQWVEKKYGGYLTARRSRSAADEDVPPDRTHTHRQKPATMNDFGVFAVSMTLRTLPTVVLELLGAYRFRDPVGPRTIAENLLLRFDGFIATARAERLNYEKKKKKKTILAF